MEVKHKDFRGVPLDVGDTVVYARGGRYGGIVGEYIIESFTPKMVRLGQGFGVTEVVMPHSLVKVVPLNG